MSALFVCFTVRGDFHPDELASFRFTHSPLLKGFVQARPEERLSPILDRPSQATATLNIRYFRGPSELHYSVLLFPTEQALRGWDVQMAHSSPAWFSPLHGPIRNGVQESRLGGEVRPNLPPMYAAVVNRVLITIGVSQHDEMIRRHPKLAQQALSDADLTQRMEKVRVELIRRAKALPANH
jgi:hypothetical protein